MVAKLKDATIHQSKKGYGGATILVGSATIFKSFENVHPKYGIMVEGARSRRLARRAECCRILRNNPEYGTRTSCRHGKTCRCTFGS